MRIARVETFLVAPRWLFCRIETDDGLVGWGEPSLEGQATVVRAAVHDLAERLLVGADPLRVEDHWQTMTRSGFYRGGPVLSSAVAGLDQALWDLAGKAAGLSVHMMLGGPVRDRVRVYGWVGGDDPHELRDAVTEQVERGLTAVKMNVAGRLSPLVTAAETAGVAARAAAVRDVLGPDRDLAVDFHGRVGLGSARRLLAALEDAHPMFVEEPLLPEQTHLLDRLQGAGTTPLAAGERLYSRAEFLPALQGGLAVVQPDVSHAGGISETRRIAALAETFGALLAPHCPLGPIALAACLQVDFATPNVLIQEQALGIHYHEGSDLLDHVVDRSVLDMADGHIARPTGPGLGIEIDEAAVRRADRVGHDWHNPVWRHDDGGFAEW